MDNSLATHLSAYATELFKDISYAYTKPSDRRRDQTRLLHELAIHGSRVVTLDLPALLKHLDMCLAEGLYTQSHLRYSATKRGYKTPVLFGDLYLQIFNAEGKLRDSPSVQSIFCLRTVLGSCKKLELPCNPRSIADEIENFIAIEEGIRKPTLNWAADDLDPNNTLIHFRDEYNRGLDEPSGQASRFGNDADSVSRSLGILQHVCDRVSTQFGDLHNEGISELPKHGPGVVSNQKRGISKFLFKYWPNKLQGTFPYDMYATTNLGVGSYHDRDIAWGQWETTEIPSRLISVPKTQKAPRLIAAEPVEHQWIQQLIKRQLEARLCQTYMKNCIDFRSQRLNQVMALAGSKDGSLATVDLSSASDRLSLWVVERAFRCNRTILERLHASRTRWLTSSINAYASRSIQLRKFAAMGSACTFPVQSIVYACLAVTAVLISEGKSHWRKAGHRSILEASRRVRVFGDDIIVPSHALGCLKELLAFCGLKVNVNKTYGIGKFRESCGVDAYDGYDVTIPYLKSPTPKVSHATFGSFLDVSNNFYRKGFWNVANWIQTLADPYGNRMAVLKLEHHHLNPDLDRQTNSALQLGWYSFSGTCYSNLKSRWNKQLQRTEVRSFLPVGKTTLLPTKGAYRLFQWFIEEPSPDTKWQSGTVDLATSKWRFGWAPIGSHT